MKQFNLKQDLKLLYKAKNTFLKSILVIFTGMLFSCGNTNKEIDEIAMVEEGFPNETTENATIYYSDSAVVKVKLQAPIIDRYYGEEERSEFPEGVDVEFYDKEGNVDSKITSNWAVQYTKDELMEARDDVVVINKKGEKLNTEHLVWDRKGKEIYSDAFVKITTADEIIYGDGLLSNEDFTKYQVQNIKSIIDVKEQEASDENIP
ncbi:MAG: LPS export ABC transporter periplasmic protein LptC [Crocinitomicaceae bacterium]|nr:LPS export ABC transporter periplasmic protein LptC [Crocinitomicaceae bacterium]|tara:strand:- start:1158 stop:1775 length:618 start_codon:yes stop_codon:yes gene_type:complete